MKLIIDIPEEKYEWVKKNNPNADTNSLVGAVVNGIPYEERPKGKWQEWINKKWGGITIYCPNCGEPALEKSIDGVYRQVRTNLCPNCGAKMKEADNG